MSNILKIAGAGVSAAAEETDENFNQTVLLLHGDGTNGAQNNTFLDSSSNGFSITRAGNTTQGTFSPFSAPDGRWSNYFQPSNYIATTATQIIPATADFTVDGWIYITSTADLSIIARQGTTGTTGRFQIYFNNTNSKIEVSLTSTVYSSTGTININEWVYVAVTRTGSDLKIYINGSLDSSHTVSGSIENTTFMVGQNWGGEDFYGYASNIRVSDTIRTISGNPTGPFTDDGNTVLLTCQSNRFVDNSSNGYAITVTGTPKVTPFSPYAPSAAYSPSVNGGSGYFDGANTSYLTDIGSVSDFNFIHNTSGLCTIEAWIYITSTDKAVHVIAMNNRNTSNRGFQFLVVSSTMNLSFRIVKGTSTVYGLVATGTTALNLNEWIHVCVEWDYVSDAGTMYINGEVETTFSADNIPFSDSDATATLKIGNNTAEADGFSWNGYISNLRISNSIVYGGAFTPSTEPLTTTSQSATNVKLLCNFTNAGIFDNTGKNNLETVGNAQIDTTTKKYGTGSMEFDGTGDWLVLPSNNDFNFGSGNWTIEAWVYFTGTPGSSDSSYAIASKWDGSATNEKSFLLRLTSSTGTKAQILCSVDGSTNLIATGSTSLSSGTWYHIAAVQNAGTVTLYVNGTSDATVAVSSVHTNNQRVYVGATLSAAGSPVQPLTGLIDDLRITKGVARYTTTFTPPTKAFPDL